MVLSIKVIEWIMTIVFIILVVGTLFMFEYSVMTGKPLGVFGEYDALLDMRKP